MPLCGPGGEGFGTGRASLLTAPPPRLLSPAPSRPRLQGKPGQELPDTDGVTNTFYKVPQQMHNNPPPRPRGWKFPFYFYFLMLVKMPLPRFHTPAVGLKLHFENPVQGRVGFPGNEEVEGEFSQVCLQLVRSFQIVPGGG